MRKVGLYGSNDPAPEGSGKIGSLEFVRKLVARGANLNARATRRPPIGTTGEPVRRDTVPAGRANRGAPLMRLLVELGADPCCRMLTARRRSWSPQAWHQFARRRIPEPKTKSSKPSRCSQFGSDINAVDKNGETAMHGAAYKQVPAAVQLLAERGAKVEIWNRKNRKGWTPLQITIGVHRGMNIQKSPATEAAVREVMIAAGVEPVVPPGSSHVPADAKQ